LCNGPIDTLAVDLVTDDWQNAIAFFDTELVIILGMWFVSDKILKGQIAE